MKRVCVVPGDGIGPEVVHSAVEVIDTLEPEIEWVWRDAGLRCHEEQGGFLPQETLASAKECDAVLFGAVTTPKHGDYLSPVLTLRKELDLYANVRRARTLIPGEKELDITIIRENTEGLYVGREREIKGGFVAEKVVTEAASRRIIQFALQYCVEHRCGHLVAVHKANLLRLSDGLFRDLFYEMTQDTGLDIGGLHIDAAAMLLVQRPERFEVIVTLNLYGDILSDLLAGLVGWMGMLPSVNMGDERAMFEPAHGSAPDLAGKDQANPTACILSGAMMLEYLGKKRLANRVEKAVRKVLEEGRMTSDLGGQMGAREYTQAVIKAL